MQHRGALWLHAGKRSDAIPGPYPPPMRRSDPPPCYRAVQRLRGGGTRAGPATSLSAAAPVAKA